MKIFYVLFLFFYSFFCVAQEQHTVNTVSLFKIVQNEKVGYINSFGQIVIEPAFISGGEFSEELAYVRIHGTYGYIDQKGNVVIQPMYDYASDFSEGLAVAYLDGKPFYINKKGEKAFECNIAELGTFINGRALVRTASKKYGMIDKTGKLLIDTLYSNMISFEDGMAVVHGINHRYYAYHEKGLAANYEVGVIDTLGHFIVPYGRYKEIKEYADGYFMAAVAEKTEDKSSKSVISIIDRNGKEIVSKAYEKDCYIGGNLHCGLIRMNLYKYWLPEKKDVSSYNKNYDGYMNVKGELVVNDTTFVDAYDFSDNRAFVRNANSDYSIINTQGRFVTKFIYNDILFKGFRNGVAFVRVGDKWGLIDTAANFIVQPMFSDIYHRGIIGDYFFFEERKISSTGDDYETCYGICKTDGTILLDAQMTDFDWRGFQCGLLKCMIQGKLTYLNKDRKIVWQGKESIPDKVLTNLNIDFMNEGEFYASSLPNNKEDFNGWSRSDNIPRKITDKKSADRIVRVYVNPVITDTFLGRYNGVTVFVENGTNTDLTFNAQDSRLYMNVQALDKAGVWRDIEYLPSSWCGNSYHTIILNAHHYWQFTSPVYEGDFKTKLRITLTYVDPTDTDKNTRNRNKNKITIYSNEYDGSVNPGQFWRTGDYIGGGIMDPYW